MTILKISGDGIEDNAITNAHLHSSAEIAGSKIADGAITNAKINSSAAIAGTKISPVFTSNVTIQNTHPKLFLTDTNNNNDFSIENANGLFKIVDQTNSNELFSTNGTVIASKINHDFSAGIDVTGNITVTGTVDGVDIATRDTLFGGLTSSSGVLSNGVTATTQSAGDNSTKVATTAYTDTAISNLVDSSPSALNTLNELAAALGDDANFSTTVTNSIATKLPLAGGTLTGALIGTTAAFSSTSSSPAFEAKGDGSSQDGYIQLNCSQNSHGIKLKSPPHSAGQSYTLTFPSDIQNAKFLTTDANGNLSWGTPTDTNTQLSNSQVRAAVEAASDSNVFTDADHSKLNGIEASATADQTASEILTLIKTVDGAGSGLDADTLDGISSSSFVRSDTNDTLNGTYTITDSGNQKLVLSGSTDPLIRFQEGTTNKAYIQWSSSGYFQLFNQETSEGLRVAGGISGLKFVVDNTTEYNVWHQGNDGSGSTLDSDKLDGQEGSYYLNYDNFSNTPTIPTNNNQLTNGAGYITSAALAGASDGGNAALLDGVDSTQFVRADQDDTLAGIITFSATNRDCINLSGAATDDNRGIAFNGRIALSADQNDGYLRLNNSSEFSNGVYTPGVIRADSGIRVHDGSSVINVINTSAQVLASRLTGALPAIDGSALTGIDSGFPSGTRMIFQQTSAPTGWTKDTSDTNQRALRVVSGTASSGGSVDFTTAFASKGVSGSIANGGNNTNNKTSYSTNNATAGGSVNNHTLNTNRMPQHRHDGGAKGIHDAANGQYGTTARGNSRWPLVRFDALNGYANYDTYWTSYTGSSHSHNHGFSGSAHSHSMPNHSHTINAHNHSFSGTAINLAVRYLDVIIAQKD